MTPEERNLVMGLVFIPAEGRTRTLDEVLAHFGESDGGVLALRLLGDAVERRDADDVEMAVIVKAAAGASGEEFMEPLIELSPCRLAHSPRGRRAHAGQAPLAQGGAGAG